MVLPVPRVRLSVGLSHTRAISHTLLPSREYSHLPLKVMLHGTIRNDDFYRNAELLCWNNDITMRATILQRCVALKVVVPSRLV